MTASNTVYRVKQLRLPFDIKFTMPGSKSHANRAIIAACLSSGKTVIHNATPCDDVSLLVKNLQKMGFDVRYTDRPSGVLEINGGIPKKPNTKRITLNCGNAGTTLRFLTSLACVVPGTFIITGNEAMRRRPIGDLIYSLIELGADIESTNEYPPIRVGAEVIKERSTHLDASKSSQYLTSLLLIAPVLYKGLKIHLSKKFTSPSYIDLTHETLKDFGVSMSIGKTMVSISSSQSYKTPKKYEIEGDWSAAGAFLVIEDLTRSKVRFTNLSDNSQQGDRLLPQVLKRMSRKGALTINCTNFPDQVMNLAVRAAFRHGETNLIGAANLRHKECNRIAVLVTELSKAGIKIKENKDGVTIRGPSKIKDAILDPNDDHRMAFCFAILGSIHSGIRIKNSKCVSKSYPSFFTDLEKLHKSPRCISIIGMRGCGKTTLAKAIAKKLSLKHIDTDALIEKKNGKIDKLVKKKGWKTFREKEKNEVRLSIKPGYIVSLGGGAIETKETCTLLEQDTIVVHLKEPASVIIKRLKKNKRPSLTDLPLEQEIRVVMKKRNPVYERLADTTTNSSKNVSELIDSINKLCSL